MSSHLAPNLLHCIYCTLDAYTSKRIGKHYIQNNGTTHRIPHEKPFYSSSFDFLEDLNQDPNLLPFSPPSFSLAFCNLSASLAFFNASLACALSEEFEKNEANPTQIERPPTGGPWGSSILSAIKARLRASLWGSACFLRRTPDLLVNNEAFGKWRNQEEVIDNEKVLTKSRLEIIALGGGASP
jgi:hypothetical protein